MCFKKSNHLTESGFSLLETFLASLLGLLISGFFMVVYLSVKASFNVQKEWSDLQQKGRFLVYFFNHILSKAGLEDCEKISNATSDFQVVGEMEKNQPVIMIYHCLPIKGKEVFSGVRYFLENKKLYFKPENNFHSKRLLIEGVRELKVAYGIACNEGEGICGYLPTLQVRDFKKVRSVALEFQLISGRLKKVWYIYVALPKRALL